MTRRQKRENDWEDDGRTIVNMNVEGMPGYIRTFDEQASAPDPAHKRKMVSPHETRMIILASMKWAFLYSMGISLLIVLFILFCVKVWLV